MSCLHFGTHRQASLGSSPRATGRVSKQPRIVPLHTKARIVIFTVLFVSLQPRCSADAYGSVASRDGAQAGTTRTYVEGTTRTYLEGQPLTASYGGAELEQADSEEGLPHLVGPRRRLLSSHIGSFLVKDGPGVPSRAFPNVASPTAVSCVEVYCRTPMGARPIIRNPENEKLLTLLGSLTLTSSIITVG
jgi:hypothetical protein